MAYLTAILRPTCGNCGKLATQELRTHRNDTVNRYCKRCAGHALKNLKASEDSRFVAGMKALDAKLLDLAHSSSRPEPVHFVVGVHDPAADPNRKR